MSQRYSTLIILEPLVKAFYRDLITKFIQNQLRIKSATTLEIDLLPLLCKIY